MSLLLLVRKFGIGCGLATAASTALFAQASFTQFGSEYAVAGTLPGDQTHASLSVNSGGGYLVWEDNAMGGPGLRVGAMKLDGTFSGSLAPFQVNQAAAGEHESPQVALLGNQSAAFVWQGGRHGMQHIFSRILGTNNAWLTGEVLVSGPTNRFQKSPALAALGGGNFVVAWESLNQAGSNSMRDVYAQILSPAGVKVGGAFLVNQFTSYNQRSPAVAALNNGGFIVVWVSEQQQRTDAGNGLPSTDVYGRLFSATGAPVSAEFLVNTGTNLCSSPSAAAADGGFVVAWTEKDVIDFSNGLDIYARSFTPLSSMVFSGGTVQRVNTQLYGDQFQPRLCAAGTNFLVVWTSLGQDSSWDGVFGQFLNRDASHSGGEFQVNTTTLMRQMQPAVASDGAGHALVVWSSLLGNRGGGNSFGRGLDLYGQRYVDPTQPLAAPAAPTVVGTSNALYVTWAPVSGLNVASYDVYVDGASNAPIAVAGTAWALTGLPLGSSHSFQLDYVLSGGQRSLISPATKGTTALKSATNGASPAALTLAANTAASVSELPFPSAPVPAANSTPLAFSAVAGNYNGLFYDTNAVISGRVGAISVTVTPKGGFTAKLQLGAQPYSFAGQFSDAGGSTTTNLGLTMDLQLDLTGGDQLTGSVTDGSWIATVKADRAGYNSSTNPVPALLTGKYTIILPGPTGNGIGTLLVDAAGNVAWNGTLADGSVVSQTTTLSKGNYWPLYAPLYSGKGFILGWVQMSGTATGPFVWSRPAIPGAAYYSGGFTNQAVVLGAHSGK